MFVRKLGRSNFNPRSSCEERQQLDEYTDSMYQFQSTLLMRGATRRAVRRGRRQRISIHAPHARSDAQIKGLRRARDISIHAPHARSDSPLEILDSLPIVYFNPRSSCEERH